jgi:glycosyltransferase involved in cell wall biosynthesis
MTTTAAIPRPAALPHPSPRVAMVAPSLEILGGQGVQAQALAQALVAEGHAVTFVPINPRFRRGFRWIRRIAYARTIVNEALFLSSLWRLRRADSVHVFSASYWSFLLGPAPALVAGRLMRKRVVLNYRSGEADDHLAHWGVLVHPWLRLADEIVVPSEYLRTVFARHGYRVRVIRNIVDTSRFRYRERIPVRPRLLSTRNLEPYYRVDVTLQAFALLKARYPDATLTIVGYGSEEERLRCMAASLGASGIRFVGKADRALLPGLYDEHDIFVNSSVLDNQPVSVLEAFAAGLPVVSTGTGDIGAMVRSGRNGLLVPPRDPGATAAAIATLLENPARALFMTRLAKEDVEKYTWPAVRGQWAEAYGAGQE